MIDELNKHHFNKLKENLNRELIDLEKHKVVNDYLRSCDWFFVAPLFFQGADLDHFLELSTQKGDQRKKVVEHTFSKFYNLNWTASFIEGYCKRCSHIEPFLFSIEHSLVLAFQRDYEGAIKTIIPIIEGILRKYLTLEKGFEMGEIKFKHLKRSLIDLQNTIIEEYAVSLADYNDENNRKVNFSKDQIKELSDLQEEYYRIWFSFIIGFVNDSLYKNTDGQKITNEINIHAILHELGVNISYTLESYLKLYFVINFLTWIFIMKEKKSVFNQISNVRFFEKSYAYYNIIKKSEKLLYDKHVLYKEYSNYEPDLLRYRINPSIDAYLSKSAMAVYKVWRFFDQLLWMGKMK